MKQRIAAAVAAMAIGAVAASAYDVKVDGIYYNIIDGEYLEVTAIEDYNICYYDYWEVAPKNAELVQNDYAGDIVVPDQVTVDGFDHPLPVETVRRGAFYRAQNLVSVKLPSTIRQIGDCAFAESAIKTLDISDAAITKIPEWLCYICRDLTEVCLPSGITMIDYGAFSLTGLRKIVIPDAVKYIHAQAFCECKDLRVLEGGKSVETVGDYCFDCANISTVVIYDNQPLLGFRAYGNNSSLQNVISYISDPANLNDYRMSSVFYGSNRECTLWVPDESLELYKASERWTSFFKNIRPLSQVGIESAVAADGEAAPALFDLGGRRVAAPAPGRVYVGTDGSKVRF